MKKALIYAGRNDELRTPACAVYPLIEFLRGWRVLWEPTDRGNSEISRVLKEAGFEVISTHIEKGFDFLKDEPDFGFDAIVSNPPYSLKDRFLERAYALKKPFYFLLSLTALEGVRRGRLFRKYGINLIVFDRRVEFMDKGSVWFATGWFFWSPYKENNRIYFKELPCKS